MVDLAWPPKIKNTRHPYGILAAAAIANAAEDYLADSVQRLVADVVTLGNGLHNNYAEHVLVGKTLPINYSAYVSMVQSLAGPVLGVTNPEAEARLLRL